MRGGTTTRGERGRAAYRAVSAVALLSGALFLVTASWLFSRPTQSPRFELRTPMRGIDSAPALAVLTAPASATPRCDVFSKTLEAQHARLLPSGPSRFGPFEVRLGRSVVGLRDDRGDELVIPSAEDELDAASKLTLLPRNDGYVLVLTGAAAAPPRHVWEIARSPVTWWADHRWAVGLVCAAMIALLLAFRSLRGARPWFRANGMWTWHDGSAEGGLVHTPAGGIVGSTTWSDGPILYAAPSETSSAPIYRGGVRERILLEHSVPGTWEQNRRSYAPALPRAAVLIGLALVLTGVGLTQRARVGVRHTASNREWDAAVTTAAPKDDGERRVLGVVRSKAWRLDALQFSKDGRRAAYVIDASDGALVGSTEGDCHRFAHPSNWMRSPLIWSDSGNKYAFFATKAPQLVTFFDGTSPRDLPADGFEIGFLPGSDEIVKTMGASLCVGTRPCTSLPMAGTSDMRLSRDGTRALLTNEDAQRQRTFVVNGLGGAAAKATELPLGFAAIFGGDHEVAHVTYDSPTSCRVHREDGVRSYGPYEACGELLFSEAGALGYLAKRRGVWTLFVDGKPSAGPAEQDSKLHVVGGVEFGIHRPAPFELGEVAWYAGRTARYRGAADVKEKAIVISGALRREHSQIAPRTVRFSDDGRLLLFGAADRTEEGWVITWNQVPVGDEKVRLIPVGFDAEEPATRKAKSDLETSCAGLGSRTRIRDAEVIADQVTVNGAFTSLDPGARCTPPPWEAWVGAGNDRRDVPLRFDIARTRQVAPHETVTRTVELIVPTGATDLHIRVGAKEVRIDLRP